jgi:hypothetical protein
MIDSNGVNLETEADPWLKIDRHQPRHWRMLLQEHFVFVVSWTFILIEFHYPNLRLASRRQDGVCWMDDCATSSAPEIQSDLDNLFADCDAKIETWSQ